MYWIVSLVINMIRNAAVDHNLIFPFIDEPQVSEVRQRNLDWLDEVSHVDEDLVCNHVGLTDSSQVLVID